MRFTSGGIGFFDSGIGGLTVLHACRRRISNLPFYYFGDNARAPYGNLSPSVIKEYTCEALTLFAKLQVRAVVLACNTVTSVCIEEMRKRFSFPLIGTEPAILPAVRKGGRVGVLTTRATRESARFVKLCQKAKQECPDAVIQPLYCDELAGMVERNIENPDFVYAPYLPRMQADGIVLGCTHYVFIHNYIRGYYQCPTYDGNEGVVCRLQNILSTVTSSPSENMTLDLPYTVVKSGKSGQPVFFLGGQKTHNKRICEHLFG